MKFTIVTNQIRSDLYISSVINLLGCHIEGESESVSRARAHDATKGFILSCRKHREKLFLQSRERMTHIPVMRDFSIEWFLKKLKAMGYIPDLNIGSVVILRNYAFPFVKISLPRDLNISYELAMIYAHILKIPDLILTELELAEMEPKPEYGKLKLYKPAI